MVPVPIHIKNIEPLKEFLFDTHRLSIKDEADEEKFAEVIGRILDDPKINITRDALGIWDPGIVNDESKRGSQCSQLPPTTRQPRK